MNQIDVMLRFIDNALVKESLDCLVTGFKVEVGVIKVERILDFKIERRSFRSLFERAFLHVGNDHESDQYVDRDPGTRFLVAVQRCEDVLVNQRHDIAAEISCPALLELGVGPW